MENPQSLMSWFVGIGVTLGIVLGVVLKLLHVFGYLKQGSVIAFHWVKRGWRMLSDCRYWQKYRPTISVIEKGKIKVGEANGYYHFETDVTLEFCNRDDRYGIRIEDIWFDIYHRKRGREPNFYRLGPIDRPFLRLRANEIKPFFCHFIRDGLETVEPLLSKEADCRIIVDGITLQFLSGKRTINIPKFRMPVEMSG